MMQTGHVFRRRRYIIKTGLQFRYIGLIFALVILASFVTGYTVFFTGWTLFGEKLANVYPQGRLFYVVRAINFTLVRNLLLVSPIVFVLGLLFSHKIAGPVYRIEKTLYEISKGNLGLKIRLREGDELWNMADMINRMTEQLNKSMVLTKDTVIEIQNEIDKIKKEIPNQSNPPAALNTSLCNLEARIKELSSSLDKWHTA